MPPRKKARLGASNDSTPARDLPTPTPNNELGTPSQATASAIEFSHDGWTDEQETALFKAMIRSKPAGIHKHFRMFHIIQQLKSQGYGNGRDRHISIPGIWEKLRSLYNLEGVDELENAWLDRDEDMDDPRQELYHAFSLPEDEYGQDVFSRRLAPEGSASPPQLDHKVPTSKVRQERRRERSISRVRAGTIDDTEEETRSSPAPVPSARGGRSKRGAFATPRTRGKSVARRRSSSRAATDETATTEDDNEDGEEEGADEGDDDEDAEPEGTIAPSHSVKTARGGARGRGRGRGGRVKRGLDRRRSSRRR